MKLFLFSILGLALATACSAPDTQMNTDAAQPARNSNASAPVVAPAQAVFPYAVQRARLRNGLQVLMVPMPSDGLVSYWSIVRTGSRDEVEPGVTGFAHFFEHMMFRGTEKLPGKAYDHIVNGMGADANAFTSDDMTAYHLSFASASLPKVIEIEADRFQNLKYTEDQFRTESGAVFGEYSKGRSSPYEVLDEAVRDVAFDKHTYKHTTIGFVADIKDMPNQFGYSMTFFKRFYRPENVVILVTGDFDPTETLETIKKNYGAWRPGYQEPKITPEPEQTAKRTVDIPFDGKTQPIVALCFKGPAFLPTDRTAMAAKLIGELAFGSTSPLYKKLVLEEQKVEGLGGSLDPTRDPGLWWIYAVVKDATAVRAVEAELWNTIADLKKTPIAAARLDAVRSHLRYSFLSNLATPSDVSESVARYIALTGDMHCIDRMFTTLATVTPEDVQRAAETWLREERCTVATLHTKGEAISALPVTEPQPAVAANTADPVAPSNGTRFSISDETRPLLRLDGDSVSQPSVLMPVAQDPTVSFRIWFQVGSQDDPVGKEGLAALTGALISEGATKKHAYDQILTLLFPLAANYGVSVDKEMTIVSGQVHRDHTGAFYELLLDAITEPAFAAEDFERLRDQAISGIENGLRYASGEELAKATLTETVFHGTPYAHFVDGTVDSLKSITLDDVRAFYAKFYTRDNVVIGLGGAYPRELPVRIKADLGVLPGGRPAHPASVKPAQPVRGRNLVLVDNPSAKGSSISMGIPIDLQRGTREFYALWIANSWLGEHRNSSSHLYQVIREERGINYGNYSYIEAFPRAGGRRMPPQGVARRQQMFEIWLRTISVRENTLFSLRAALREIETLVEKGLTREQFEFTKNFLKGYSSHYAESTYERLGYALDDRFYGLDSHLTQFKKMMNEITLDEVNAAIKKYMKVDDLMIAIVAPDAAELKALVVSGAPTPVVYPEGLTKPAEILAEDAKIQAWPLGIQSDDITIREVTSMFQASNRGPSRN
ncbi:MAG: insulinase family protein [Planctomycetes bacterium]|nr:insulinase family protein [Planctomycetota bacterium]